jgi:hypothetical protein
MQEVKNDKKEKGEQNILSDNEREKDAELNQAEIDEEDVSKVDLPEKSQIYLVELMFIFPILVVADILDIFSLTGYGAVISWAMDLITTGIVGLWLWWKGRRAEWNLIANLIEFIPVVDVLPWRTTMMIILLIKDSKTGEKILNKIEKVSDKNRGKSSSSKIINISRGDINNNNAA